ncbi:MAG TPA: DUF4202 family protein [Thermoanaerobaculia bacterium]|nr:DUF4202 family protein [Thermoanaerobaculia bacterium]
MLEEVEVLFRQGSFDESYRGVMSAQVAREFPSIFVTFDTECADRRPRLSSSEWNRPDFDTWRFDTELDELARGPFTLCIADDAGGRPGFPLEVLNRCQRVIGRRNQHSQGQLFDRVLRRHHALHDLDKPLVRADYNHALDVWQWLLRLESSASLALQLAALFHDIERLQSESDQRVEHLAGDYQQFKDQHAQRGAEMTIRALDGVPCAPRVAEIVAKHERQSDDDEIALLNDADALSFFSLNSCGYADYFGEEQTRKKVAYTWNRMRPAARAKLASVHLRGDIKSMLDELR